MLFDNNEYLDMLFNVNGNNYNYAYNMQTQNSSSLSEGFLRGNMFDSEFVSYKNMNYIMPKAKTEREKDLFKIMESSFEIIDYGLYLDVHPDDMMILNKYNMETEKYEKLKKEYEEKYGPLCITKGGYNSFEWIKSSWPWDKEDGKYV